MYNIATYYDATCFQVDIFPFSITFSWAVANTFACIVLVHIYIQNQGKIVYIMTLLGEYSD